MSRARHTEILERLDAATVEALDTLRDIMERGGIGDRMTAARQILDRSMPVPKVSPAQLEAAARGASAGASDRTVALARASERQAAKLTPPADTKDATFTPLPRVQTDE